MNETAYALYESAEKLGVLFVLDAFAPDVAVRLPLSNAFCKRSLEGLQLSVRSQNALMKNDANNVGEIVRIIMSETGLAGVRNLGKKSINEIKTVLLALGYEELSDRERIDFWHHFVRLNDLPEFISGGEENA